MNKYSTKDLILGLMPISRSLMSIRKRRGLERDSGTADSIEKNSENELFKTTLCFLFFK